MGVRLLTVRPAPMVPNDPQASLAQAPTASTGAAQNAAELPLGRETLWGHGVMGTSFPVTVAQQNCCPYGHHHEPQGYPPQAKDCPAERSVGCDADASTARQSSFANEGVGPGVLRSATTHCEWAGLRAHFQACWIMISKCLSFLTRVLTPVQYSSKSSYVTGPWSKAAWKSFKTSSAVLFPLTTTGFMLTWNRRQISAASATPLLSASNRWKARSMTFLRRGSRWPRSCSKNSS
mmetsp:Transcript_37898/g.67749  ORF Transcript_37898/g.67749 Transcript_37898/m.67749 type:complete len:235 (-) Transcript_37898:1089-1793(-)